MAIRPILEAPHPILSQVARPVAAVTPEIRALLEDMAETMYDAPGVGLAAPQVGEPIRAIVFDPVAGDYDEDGNRVPSQLHMLVNPEIVEGWGDIISIEEGCLSVPDLLLEVPRNEHIRVRALNEQGEQVEHEFSGYVAIIVQHELDHLEGVTLFGRASKLKRRRYVARRKKALARAR